jgi:type IV secretory pathway TraG/TraD family ATPase VirD4
MTDFLLHLLCVAAALNAALVLRSFRLVRIYLNSFAVAAAVGAVANLDFNIIFIAAVALSIAAAYYLAVSYLSNDEDDGSEIRRGAAVADARDVAKMLKKEKSRFDIGGIPIPVELETRSFLFAGSPGTGKSQALTRALDSLEKSGARAIIADASGIYCERFYNEKRGDVILNPLDERSVSWSPLSEIETVADIPAISKSLVPDSEGEAKAWSEYAQQFLDAVLEYCFTNDLTNRDLLEIVASAEFEQLQQICAGTPAAALLKQGNERMFASVRGSAIKALEALKYLDPGAGKNAFSIRKHIAEQRPGWIYLTYQQQHRDGLSRMICAAIDVASRAVLSLPPDLNRRVIFALDELPLLGKVQSIVELLTNGRKYGAVVFVGLQTIAQLRNSFGKDTAQTLLSCLGSWLVLRVNDAETADFMSRYLGEQEIERFVESSSKSSSWAEPTARNSETRQQQIVTQRAVLPAELQQLPDLVGYFKLPGSIPMTKIRLSLAPQRKQAPAFVPAALQAREKKPVIAQKPALAQHIDDDLL